MSGFLADARAYAARGWSIIPIGREKRPAVKWSEYQNQRPTGGQLERWFGRDGLSGLHGLAVILGDVSGGLVCRDFDTLDGYQRWAASYPELARTLPTVETARGRHVYFRSSWTGFRDLGDGELRGDSGHYSVLPPSKHPDETVYRWLVPLPDGPLPEIDPSEAGFLPETERAETTETAERAETPERTEQHCSTSSVCSALSVAPAVDPLLNDAIEAAIRDTLPKTAGQRNRAVFELARALKAIPALADAPVGELRGIVRRWHERALPFIRTEPFDETWADFVNGWPKVRFPKGEEPMALIVQRADAAPLPAVALNYDTPETRRLIAICRELQRASGSEPFFLSCGTAAKRLGMDPATAWRRLKMLVADGVLTVVQPGKQHRATRYRYVRGD